MDPDQKDKATDLGQTSLQIGVHVTATPVHIASMQITQAKIVADIATRPFGLMICKGRQTDRQTLSVQHEIFRAKDAKVCVKSGLHENKRTKTARQEYTTQTSTAPRLAVLRKSGSTTDRCY